MTGEPAPKLIGVGMDHGYDYPPGGLVPGHAQYQMGQTDLQYMDHGNNLQGQFGPLRSGMLGNHAFPSGWSGQSRQH
jgi:hypothetical protein